MMPQWVAFGVGMFFGGAMGVLILWMFLVNKRDEKP